MNNQALEAFANIAAAAAKNNAQEREESKNNQRGGSEGETDQSAQAPPQADPATLAALSSLPPHLLQGNPQLQHLRSLGLGGALGGSPDLSFLGLHRPDPSMQNMAYLQLLAQQQQSAAPGLPNSALAAAASQLASLLQGSNTPQSMLSTTNQQQANDANAAATMPPPPNTAPTSPAASAAKPTTAKNTKKKGRPPQMPQSFSRATSSSGSRSGADDEDMSEGPVSKSLSTDSKKEQKRAANRRSAQLSRKRKKQFIEELKDENDDLRRKEQILKSIPDLIVVFDSTGKLWFVSQSITRFIQFKASELEGKSFWERLCPDSVRLLKAAFMDSLAARESNTDTVPLGSGLWDLRLLNKDGSLVTVTLNGVVHFAGERPECVCCIRPKESSGDEGDIVQERPSKSLRQDIVSDESQAGKATGKGKGREAIRISDSCNSSDSVSGSSDD